MGLNTGLALYSHSRLFQYKTTVYPEVPTSEVAPDAAESFEISPDKLSVTFKLKGDVKLDARAPTNGRPLNSGDVVFSWNKYTAQSPYRKDLNNSLNPFGPVVGVSAPDDKTVVFKLAFPYVAIVPFLAYPRYGQIQPKEADGGYNPQVEARGSGPWRLEKYQQDVEMRFSRNPDWYNKGKPYFDTMSYRFIPEYATVLSQFRAGQIWEYNNAGNYSLIHADDILPLKRDVPKLNMIQTPSYQRTANVIFFGSKPGSPWADARVRQAASMLLDRDLILDAFFATKNFVDAGSAGRQALAHPHPGRRDAVLGGPQDRRLRSVLEVLQARPRRGQGAAQGRRIQRPREAALDDLHPHLPRQVHGDLQSDDDGVRRLRVHDAEAAEHPGLPGRLHLGQRQVRRRHQLDHYRLPGHRRPDPEQLR